jgi:hypothetical protein
VVDRLFEGSTDPRFEPITRVSEILAGDDQAAIGSTASDAGVGGLDRRIASGPDRGEGRSGIRSDHRVRHGTTPDQRVVLAAGLGITGGHRRQVEPAQAQAAPGIRSHRGL